MNKIKTGGITILGILFILISCTEEPLNVGLELLPETDLLTASSDTLQIDGFTVKGYLNYTSNIPFQSASAVNRSAISLGQVTDPVFGTSTSEITLQLNYQEDAKYTFDKNAVSDQMISFKLYLHIDQTKIFGSEYGFNVNVFPLNEKIDFPTDFTFLHVTNNPLGYIPANYIPSYKMKSEEYNFNRNLCEETLHNEYINHSNIVDIDSNNFYLIIDLDTNYFLPLMDTIFINDNKIYSSQLKFTDQFPGLYIQPEIANAIGGIENIKVASSYAIMEYNRTFKDQSQNDSTVTKYSSFKIAEYINMFDHQSNYSPYGGPFSAFLGDTITTLENFYIQSIGGVRGLIHLAEFDDFRKTNSDIIGVNLAEIVIPVDRNFMDTTQFYLPERITLQEYIEDIKVGVPIIDEMLISNRYSPGYFTGFLDKESMEYRVNVTEYAHRYMHNSSSTGWFYVMPSLTNQNHFSEPDYGSPGRAVFNNFTNRPFLRLIYTYTTY